MSILEQLKKSGHQAMVKWFYSDGDIDMRDEGEEFDDILDLGFEIISLESDDQDSEDDDFFSDIMDDTFLN